MRTEKFEDVASILNSFTRLLAIESNLVEPCDVDNIIEKLESLKKSWSSKDEDSGIEKLAKMQNKQAEAIRTLQQNAFCCSVCGQDMFMDGDFVALAKLNVEGISVCFPTQCEECR